MTIGVGLNARGIMEIVIANTAYVGGLISLEVFFILLVMSLLATLTTPLFLKRAFRYMDDPRSRRICSQA